MLAILAVLFACPTYGAALLLLLPALAFNEYRASCADCGWKWKAG